MKESNGSLNLKNRIFQTMFNRSCAQNKAIKLVCNEKILLYGIIMAIAALKPALVATQLIGRLQLPVSQL
jgi:hypothetical protein